jgi:hypothetical protein
VADAILFITSLEQSPETLPLWGESVCTVTTHRHKLEMSSHYIVTVFWCVACHKRTHGVQWSCMAGCSYHICQGCKQKLQGTPRTLSKPPHHPRSMKQQEPGRLK